MPVTITHNLCFYASFVEEMLII